MSILAVGSLAYDTIETPFGRADDVLGGAAVYFALAAALFGHVRVVGVVGEDFREEDLELLRRRGIDLSGVVREPGRTFRWGGRYGFDLNTRDTLFTELNVFEGFRPRIPAPFRDSRLVFLGNIDPGLQLEVLDAVPEAGLSACDTMNFWIERQREALEAVLRRVDVLVVNDEEARQLSGTPHLRAAAAAIHALGPRHLVIKKGEHGALLFGPDGIFSAAGFPLESIVDPTGAGDAFAGGFLGALSEAAAPSDGGRPRARVGAGLRRAVVYGCVMGSFCVEAFGTARLQSITRPEVEERFEAFLRLTRVTREAGE